MACVSASAHILLYTLLKSLDESKTASMEVRYNREHRHVLQLELEKITMREQIDSLNARHSELETELREAIHEKNKMERAHRCTQESIEVLESQKSKLERLLKTAESVVADRDKLIRVMEERQTSFTTTDMGLGSPRSPRSAPPQVRELERALNEKQHQLIDYERRLELANSELRAMKSLASDTSATPSGQRSLQAECKRLTAEVSSLQKQLADVKTASEVKFNRQLKLAQEQRETDQQLLLAVTAQRDELETTVHQMRSATSVTSATTGSVVMQQTRTITDRNSASVASEMAQVKANLRVAQKENSELKLCVEEKEREILEVKTAKIEIDKQRQVIENRLGDLQSALKAATTDKMSAEHTLMCLRSDAQNTADRIAELEGELSRRHRALDTLGQEKQSLKTKFDKALRRVADLERIAEKGSEVERDYATISQENLGLRRQVDDFERQIKEFAGEKDMLKKKLAASSEELVQAESALKEVDGSAKNQAAMLKEKSRLVDKLQAEIDDVHAQYCTHTAEQQAEIKQLGEKVVARDAEIIAVRGQVEELTAEVTLKKQSIETLEKRIGSLKHSLEEMKNHAEELYQQQQMQLEEQRKETIDALDAAKVHLARVAEVEDEKRRLNSKNTELTASVQFLEDALADSKRTNELSSGNTHILEQRVAELQKELKQAQEKYHAFGADTARLSSEIDRLQAALKVRDAKISGKDEQLARNRAALEKVEEELGTSAEWGRRLTVTNHELEQKIKAAETELASTCAELDEKKRTVARLEKDARSKGDELAIAQRDISDAQLRVEVLEKDLQNAIERMETMRARNDELLDELDGVRKREGQSVDSLNDTERELHDRERQVAALENKVKALQTERDQYAAKVEKLSAAEKASRKQLDTLHVRVSKMTSTLEGRLWQLTMNGAWHQIYHIPSIGRTGDHATTHRE